MTHNVAAPGKVIEGTNVAVHSTVTETTKLATAPELARRGVTMAEQAAGATVDTAAVVTDAVMDAKDNFDLVVNIVDAADILHAAAEVVKASIV